MGEETANEVVQTAQDAVQEVNKVTLYMQENIPTIIAFGIKVLLAIIVFCIGRIVIHWIQRIVRKSLERSTVDKGVEQFVDSLLKVILYFFLIFSIATKFGVDTTSVAALVASAGVAVGLALQGSLSNFAGGILILFLKPFKVGDYIVEHATGKEGTVKEIQIFYTKLSTVDNQIIVIPNGALTNSSLTNATDQDKRLLNLKISISYEADLKKAKRVLKELIEGEEHIRLEDGVSVFVSELGDSAVYLGVRAWIDTEFYWPVRWQILEDIKLCLDENGIEIPYPQMSVHVKERG